MNTPAAEGETGRSPLRILMLIEPQYLYINTIREYCEAFDLFSKHHYSFAAVGRKQELSEETIIDYSSFDVLMIHYSARVAFWETSICTGVIEAIRSFSGPKILFIQDEYDRTAIVWDRIRYLGINKVFTCVPKPYIDRVYPPDKCSGVEFHSILTGYVPPSLEMGSSAPLEERPYAIVYRGRSMSYVYGDLGREKIEIGKSVRAACEEKQIPVDIEWTEDKRIYRAEWSKFLESGRATLGTESGCNVFDMDGSIREEIEKAIGENPDLTYEEAKARFFEEENIGVKMNQISPKFIEFIASRTALILYEGTYSGILQANVHYLSLKKDGSNLDEILEAVGDLELLKKLTDRAYADIVEGGHYSFKAFARNVDKVLESVSPSSHPAQMRWARSDLSIDPPLTYTDLYQKAFIGRIIKNIKGEVSHPGRFSISYLNNKIENFQAMISRRKEKIAKLEQSGKKAVPQT